MGETTPVPFSGAGVASDAVRLPFRPPVPEWDFLPVPAIQEGRTWELTGGLRQLAIVRRGARQYLTECSDNEDAVERAVQVMDELASNAIRHGAAPARLDLCHHDTGWLVIATDCAPQRPPRPAVGRPVEKGGMGLYVVADLSTAHGIECTNTSKHVWALLAGV